MSWPFDPLTPMKYGAILIDPPWAYQMRSAKGHAKSPEAHYDTMTEADLAALPVGQLAAPDCLLFMWSTWPHLDQAQRLLTGWGFRFVTGGAWVKRTPSGKATFGTGYVLRSACEPFLVGKIGSPQVAVRNRRNLIEAESVPDLIDGLRREHSRKPPEMRALVEELCPTAFCAELFAREAWPGQEVWGNEVEKFGEAV